MLPLAGVTGREPFLSASLGQKKTWLPRLYKMMQRGRVRAGAEKVDAEFVAVNMPVDSLTRPFVFTDQEVRRGVPQSWLEELAIVLQTFPLARSPASMQNVAPSKPQATVLTALLDEVKTCYEQIAAGQADEYIEAVFSNQKMGQVRDTFRRAAKTVKGMKNFLENGNPPPGTRNFRMLLDTPGELTMKSAGALSAPWEMILPPSFAAPTTVSAVRTDQVNTLLHECMHVLSSQIVDTTYWPDPNFTSLPFATKINNADHFAQVARLHKKTDTPLPGGDNIFASIKKVEDQQLISAAVRQAREKVNAAWIYSLDAWNALRRLYDDPNSYDHLSVSLQRPLLMTNMILISRISKATMHARTSALNARLTSVTGFDLGLIEETIVDLARLVGYMQRVVKIKFVPKYPDIPEPEVLYVTEEDLSKRSIDVLANSFLKYGFSSFDQKEVWLDADTIVANIAAMVTNKKSFRSLPDKPNKR